jgi:hypothetical protein
MTKMKKHFEFQQCIKGSDTNIVKILSSRLQLISVMFENKLRKTTYRTVGLVTVNFENRNLLDMFNLIYIISTSFKGKSIIICIR